MASTIAEFLTRDGTAGLAGAVAGAAAALYVGAGAGGGGAGGGGADADGAGGGGMVAAAGGGMVRMPGAGGGADVGAADDPHDRQTVSPTPIAAPHELQNMPTSRSSPNRTMATVGG